MGQARRRMATLGLAAIQLAGKKQGNLELLESEVRSVARRFPWVDMIVCGELAIHGADVASAEPVDGPTEQRLRLLAKEVGLWLIPGSLYLERDGRVYNSAPVIDPRGEIVARYDKMFPFLPYEKRVESGVNYVVFDVPGAGRVGVVICYDIWFPEVVRTLAAMGAEAVIAPTMTNTIDRDVELSIARANAAINQCYFIDVNVAGDQGNGRSVFYGPGGELINECGAGRDVVALEIDFEQVRRARARGWHGLGQTLKSFRDSPVEFPYHADRATRAEKMRALGPLEMPCALRAAKGEKTDPQDKQGAKRLRIID